MDKDIKKALSKAERCVKDVLESVNNNVEKCVELLKKESPILIEEIIRWEIVSNVIPFILALVSMSVFTIFAIITKGWWYLLLVGSVISFLFCCHYTTWLKVWIAPRLFLIEYVKKFIPKKQGEYN